MSEELDPNMEALFKEAQSREDVFRFRQVLREVASEVEAREETPVISIARKTNWKWLALAASVALLLTVGVALFGEDPNAEKLAMVYAEGTTTMTRGEGGAEPTAHELLFDEARSAILNGDALAALTALEVSQPEAKCDKVRKQWLMGLAYLLGKRVTEAEREFQVVANSGCQDKESAKKLLKEL